MKGTFANSEYPYEIPKVCSFSKTELRAQFELLTVNLY